MPFLTGCQLDVVSLRTNFAHDSVARFLLALESTHLLLRTCCFSQRDVLESPFGIGVWKGEKQNHFLPDSLGSSKSAICGDVFSCCRGCRIHNG